MTVCSRCGLPYHRYSPEDPEHAPDEYGCINSLRARIEQLEAFIADSTVVAGALAEIAVQGCPVDRSLAADALAKFNQMRLTVIPEVDS